MRRSRIVRYAAKKKFDRFRWRYLMRSRVAHQPLIGREEARFDRVPAEEQSHLAERRPRIADQFPIVQPIH